MKCTCGGRLAFKLYDPIKCVRVYECKSCGKWLHYKDTEEEDREVREVVTFT